MSFSSVHNWAPKSLLLLYYIACFLSAGCSTTSAQKKPALQEVVQPLLSFQRTPCLGSCPAYNAKVYSDGSATFVPFRNALAQDTLRLLLTKQELQQLKQEIAALDYRHLQNSYLSGWSDISSTYLTFYEDGREVKRVKHQEGGPAPLAEFIALTGALLEQKAKEKSLPTY